MATDIQTVTLAIILGTLIAIVYSLRILVLLERRIARIDHHIELMATAILRDERKVLAAETRIERMIKSGSKSTRKTAKKTARKKPAKKKATKKKATRKKR